MDTELFDETECPLESKVLNEFVCQERGFVRVYIWPDTVLVQKNLGSLLLSSMTVKVYTNPIFLSLPPWITL